MVFSMFKEMASIICCRSKGNFSPIIRIRDCTKMAGFLVFTGVSTIRDYRERLLWTSVCRKQGGTTMAEPAKPHRSAAIRCPTL